jgi:hypothetical protein
MKNKEQNPDDEQEELDEAEELGDEAPENSTGLAWLYSLADKVLRKIARTIVDALSSRAREGDANAIKLLIAIAKNKPPEETPAIPGGKTLAQKLAEEPEWHEPLAGAKTDKNNGEPAA